MIIWMHFLIVGMMIYVSVHFYVLSYSVLVQCTPQKYCSNKLFTCTGMLCFALLFYKNMPVASSLDVMLNLERLVQYSGCLQLKVL